MPDLYLLFSHNLTEQQENEAYETLDVEGIYYLPDDLIRLWAQVPADIPDLKEYVRPIKVWLAKELAKGDYIIIQGDFGATYLMVNWALEKGYRPIYATTERKAIEVHNGDQVTIKKIFEHVRFRLYKNT